MCVAARRRIIVGVVVVSGKSIALHFSQADDKVAERGARLQLEASYGGSFRRGRRCTESACVEESCRLAGFRAVTLSTPPLRVDFALSHTQFSATPVGIGIVCVK